MAVSFRVLSLARQSLCARMVRGYRFLAKREATAVGRQASAAETEKSRAAERRYAPMDEEHPHGETSEAPAETSAADKKNQPNIPQPFGPGPPLDAPMLR